MWIHFPSVRSVLLVCTLAFVALIGGGCGDRTASQVPVAKAPEEPSKPPRKGEKPPWAGGIIHGDDPDSLKAYLASVKEVTPTKFNVEWSPATVAFDKNAALRALRGVSRDGRRFSLDPAEPSVAKLVPGSILWIYNVTVSKVVRVERQGGSAVVYTKPVPLNEAMPNAEITFEARVPVGNFMLDRRRPRAQPSAPTAHLINPAGYFRLASLGSPEPAAQPENSQPVDSTPNDAAAEDQASADEDAFEGNTLRMNLKGYDMQIGYAPGDGDTLKIRIEARKAEADDGSGGASQDAAETDALKEKMKELREMRSEETKVRNEIREIRTHLYEAQEGHAENPVIQGQERLLKDAISRKEKLNETKLALKRVRAELSNKIWEFVSDNFDARFKAQVDLDGFSTAGHFLFSQGNVEEAQLAFKALNARAKVKVVTRLGKKGTEGSKIPLMDVPIVFNVPMPIGGIPFVLQIGADFNINVFLSGMNATLAVEGAYAVNGNTGFTYSKTSAQYDSALNSEKPGIVKAEGMTPGLSAFVLGVQLPKIGYGVGMFGVSSMAYFDVIHVLTMTSASSAVVALAPACKRITYAATGRIGIETEVLPIPIEVVQTFVKDKLNPKHEVFKKEHEVLVPNIKGCEIG